MYIAHNEKLQAGVIAGLAAAGEKFLERLNDIDSFEKSSPVLSEGKKGKALVKSLQEKGYIDSLPKTLLLPFITVGGITALFLYILRKTFPKNKDTQG